MISTNSTSPDGLTGVRRVCNIVGGIEGWHLLLRGLWFVRVGHFLRGEEWMGELL